MKTTLILLLTILVLLIVTTVALAQPQGLPGAPDQAPINGGLGLLAAAGGAYAWKKLKKKNSA
ncbi:MAG: hypothetical protein RI564_09265 [Gracilimonas sp.]|nr:hypothetical protein [Gracilimonas sp.]